MSYIFMAFHYPKAENRDDLIRGMLEMREIMAQAPGFIDAGPWVDDERGRIVGISRWQSRADFEAAVPPGMGTPTDDIHEWETRPRELFHLDAATAAAPTQPLKP